MKILTVVGARPQFIKAAALSPFLDAAGIEEQLLHTGQHYDPLLSDVFFRELGLKAPKHCLRVGSASHGAQTARMLEGIERVLDEERPDLVLVYGDTNSTLAGALAAAKRCVPVAHVEAGLRSFNRRMPEEVNRVLTDHMAELLFAPSHRAADRLFAEGLPGSRIHFVGDVQYDACLRIVAMARKKGDVTTRLGLEPGRFALATIHRQENTDDPARLRAILEGLESLAKDLPVLFPAHPRTVAAANRAGIETSAGRGAVRWIDPLGYGEMMALTASAGLVVTDSGGVQKEAFFLRVPCLTVREETEWPETVELGWNRLVRPAEARKLAPAAKAALGSKGREGRPYGDGLAAKRIVEVLEQWRTREA